ncbi:ABC transporter permease [Streptococcus sp. H49]|uniref:ABC transporter permease n=1 Tax=Streptococcus huangxiaojuni TaxID=3237239 RepID=UPI0034A57174
MSRRLAALIWLRGQVILSNKSILLQILIPFAFTYFYKYLYGMDGGANTEQMRMLLMLCLPFSLTLAVGNPISAILSEEKEKNNLRTLLLSGVRNGEYIAATIAFPLVLTFLVLLAIPMILEVSLSGQLLNYIGILFLTALAVILLYLLIGLVSRNQVTAQVISLPAMLFIIFLPMVSTIDKTVTKLTDYSFMGLMTKLFSDWDDFTWDRSLFQILSLFSWIILLIILNSLAIKNNKKIK